LASAGSASVDNYNNIYVVAYR